MHQMCSWWSAATETIQRDTGRWQKTTPRFPSKSTFRRGRPIVQVVHVNQISDTSALQGYANQLRDESLISNYQLQFEAPAAPDHGVGDIIGIDDPNVGGIFEEASWSLALAVGEMMQINAQKMVVM